MFDTKLLWRATLEDGTLAVVKFTRRYSADGHRLLDYHADGPDLATSTWRMIVMEEITDAVDIDGLSLADQASV